MKLLGGRWKGCFINIMKFYSSQVKILKVIETKSFYWNKMENEIFQI